MTQPALQPKFIECTERLWETNLIKAPHIVEGKALWHTDTSDEAGEYFWIRFECRPIAACGKSSWLRAVRSRARRDTDTQSLLPLLLS